MFKRVLPLLVGAFAAAMIASPAHADEDLPVPDGPWPAWTYYGPYESEPACEAMRTYYNHYYGYRTECVDLSALIGEPEEWYVKKWNF
ncbi:hypothetical protein ACIBG8_09780 [Nonomuraea sp. NPDC050556]|uniref:hypothetical protein n=1 Tax=Nonomuraea sp. NPDC050556 TaxID=3364369 RepID=UPI00379BA62B